ncbi:MAG: hypothetical protein OEY08_04190 [Gammaproteobacteria bacterium]|nr:hypothetical protein [Gammaproteobacteria bacterium]
MRNEVENQARRLTLLPAVSCCLVILVSVTGFGQAPDDVVPITMEPDHKIRLDNGKVRVYEIFLRPGKGTLLHEHRADNFTVNFGDAVVTLEPSGGIATTVTVATGDVGFASTASGPYTHRVLASGQTDFHGVAVELMSATPGQETILDRRADPPFHLVRENSRGRAYRIRLAPGASTGQYARAGTTVLIAISAGRIAEEIDGKPRRLWDFETGHLRWMEDPERLSLRNEGPEPVDLVELEIY